MVMNYYNFNLITFIHCDPKTVKYKDDIQSIEFMLLSLKSCLKYKGFYNLCSVIKTVEWFPLKGWLSPV